jgi:hypothetical protein
MELYKQHKQIIVSYSITPSTPSDDGSINLRPKFFESLFSILVLNISCSSNI